MKAANLAANPLQLAVARKQLQEIRKLQHESVRTAVFDGPLTVPAFVFAAMMAALFVVMLWK